MKIEAADLETGKKFQAETNSTDDEFIDFLQSSERSEVEIKRFIDNLDISADTKQLFYKFSKATITVGEYVIKIGRKIMDFIAWLLQEFPKATVGLLFGAIVIFLVGSIPIIGVAVGSLAASIMTALGFIEDVQDKQLKRKIGAFNARFDSLKADA